MRDKYRLPEAKGIGQGTYAETDFTLTLVELIYDCLWSQSVRPKRWRNESPGGNTSLGGRHSVSPAKYEDFQYV